MCDTIITIICILQFIKIDAVLVSVIFFKVMCIIISNYNGYVIKCCTMWSLSAFYNIVYKFLFVNLPVSVFNVELECLFLRQECITELLFECFQSPSSLFFHENRLTDQHTVNLWSLKHSSNLTIVLLLLLLFIFLFFIFWHQVVFHRGQIWPEIPPKPLPSIIFLASRGWLEYKGKNIKIWSKIAPKPLILVTDMC